MRVKVLDTAQIVMSNRGSMHNYFGWPTVARLKNGRIAAAASGNRLAHVDPFGKAMIAFSEDEGETFGAQAAVIDTILDDRDTGLCPFGDCGLIVTSFNLSKAHINAYLTDPFLKQFGCRDHIEYAQAYLDQISDRADTEAKGSHFRVSYDNGVTFGPIYKSPVTSPHGPQELADGSILWVGPLHSGDLDHEQERKLFAYRIYPDGNCEQIGEVPELVENGEKMQVCEPHVVQLPDNRLICHIRTEGGKNGIKTIYQTESEDLGRSWTMPHRILGEHSGAPAHLLLHSDGVLISAYANYGVNVALSTDGGRTWETEHCICEDTTSTDMGYPSTVELADKSLLTVFYANKREGGAAEVYKIRWSLEADE